MTHRSTVDSLLLELPWNQKYYYGIFGLAGGGGGVTALDGLTAVFKKVATFNIDFASSDGNRTHHNAFGSCDGNFVREIIEIKWIKHASAK